MTDQEILDRLGLQPDEIRELFRKLNEFFNTLDEKQKRAFTRSLRSTHEAAGEIDRDVTPQRLETFLREFAPPDGIICEWCELKHHK
jgi:hypothetical protein